LTRLIWIVALWVISVVVLAVVLSTSEHIPAHGVAKTVAVVGFAGVLIATAVGVIVYGVIGLILTLFGRPRPSWGALRDAGLLFGVLASPVNWAIRPWV
jgi:hypothetical protein